MQQFSYLVDASTIQLSDDGMSWIQCMPLGKWEHPWHGEIQFTDQNITAYAQNVQANVMSKELDIDYEHKMYSGEAAGWVKAAEARPGSGLWIQVAWTPRARKALADGEYRYFSPEYMDEWTHPKTGVTYKCVLAGGGLTNRPFLKGILPINLSEAFETQQGVKMPEPTPPAGPEPTTPPTPTPQPTPPAPTPPAPTPPAPTEPTGPTQLSEAQLTAALENHPLVKQLQEANKQLMAASLASSVEVQLNEFKTGSKVLSEAALGQLRIVLSTAPKAVSDEVVKLVKMFTDKDVTGVVQLGEIGGQAPAQRGNGDDIKKFTDAISAKQTELKLSYTEAAILVSREQPALHTAYLEATASANS